MSTHLVSVGVQFPNASVQKTALPSGTILLWESTVSIPTGWLLCDGTNGTPDLRDRFIVGAGSTYAVGAVGGEATVTLSAPQMPPHTHSVTAGTTGPNGAHSHTRSIGANAHHSHTVKNFSTSPAPALGSYQSATNRLSTTSPVSRGTSQPHAHTFSTGAAGIHAHPISVSVNPAGATDPHNNIPPYYALAFIIKE